jgi:hypothetical protein
MLQEQAVLPFCTAELLLSLAAQILKAEVVVVLLSLFLDNLALGTQQVTFGSTPTKGGYSCMRPVMVYLSPRGIRQTQKRLRLKERHHLLVLV